MTKSAGSIPIYLETGQKRTFACALDWPGWSRSGRDEESAIQALLEYGPRYARALEGIRPAFKAPRDGSELVVTERLKGDATTDFGAPGRIPAADSQPVDASELRWLQKVLQACWTSFDGAVQAASGKALRLGPRGGGRDAARIIQHVLGAEEGYLVQLGRRFENRPEDPPGQQLEPARRAILEALTAAARGEIPARGPRGGLRWPARYFVRREAWHVLDHAWEIEDRIIDGG